MCVYDSGPDNWASIGYTICDDERQSPIDIDHRESTPFNDLLPFKFYGYDDRAEIMSYLNDGHTAKITIRENEDQRGAPYVNKYLCRFHMHNNF